MVGIPSDSSENLMLHLQKNLKYCNFYMSYASLQLPVKQFSNPPPDFSCMWKENRTLKDNRLLDKIEEPYYWSQSATWAQHLSDIRKWSWDLHIGLHKVIGDQDSVVSLLLELVINKDEIEVS